MKKTLSFVLCALLVCVLVFAVPLSPFAHADIAASEAEEAVPWVITDSGALIIGDGGSYAFPYAASRLAADYGWNSYRSSITSVSFSGSVSASGSIGEMFANCYNLNSVSFSGFDISGVSDVSGLFKNCVAVGQLTLPHISWDATVTNMFYGMTALWRLNLNGCPLSGSGLTTPNHLWGLSSGMENFDVIHTAEEIESHYASDSARSYERVFQISYNPHGATGYTATSVVRISAASSHTMAVPSSFGWTPPVNSEFKYWVFHDGTGTYYGGSPINLNSFGSDTINLFAMWRSTVSWSWAADGSYATATLDQTGATYTDTAPALVSDTHTCTSDGIRTLKATAVFGEETYTDLHDFASPARHELSYVAAVAPQCTADGVLEHWHCSRCGNDYRSSAAAAADLMATVVDPRLGHDWGEPSYVWAANNASATATRVCARDASHVETETRFSSYGVTTPPSCDVAGVGTYTVSFSNTAFPAQHQNVSINPLGHIWGEPSYVWYADNSHATASRICERDHDHVDSETVASTVETFVPACLTSGLFRYTATFANPVFETQVKTAPGPSALGHDLIYHAIKLPGCKTTGNIEYWECSRCGEFFTDEYASAEIEDRSSVVLAALGHNIPADWRCDERGHWHECTRCGITSKIFPHVWDHPPTVEESAHCVECGYLMSGKLRIHSYAFFGATGDLELATVTYTKKSVLDDEWVVELPEREPVQSGFYFEGWIPSSDNELHESGDKLPFTFAERRAVIVRGVWTEIIGSGSYALESETRYRFDEGSYKLVGDACVYYGEQPFYSADNVQIQVVKAG